MSEKKSLTPEEAKKREQDEIHLNNKRNELVELLIGEAPSKNEGEGQKNKNVFGKGLIGRMSISEVYQMIEFVKGKGLLIDKEFATPPKTQDRADARKSRREQAPMHILNSTLAAEIAGTLPIVDAVVTEQIKRYMNMLNRGNIPAQDASINKEFEAITLGLTQVKDALIPLVDKACASGLVRDKVKLAEYEERRFGAECEKFGVNPSAKNAKQLLAEARNKVKDAQKAENERRTAVNAKLLSDLGLDGKKTSDRKKLGSIKKTMETNGINPESDDAAQQYLALPEAQKAPENNTEEAAATAEPMKELKKPSTKKDEKE